MSKVYTDKEKYEILQNAAIIVKDDEGDVEYRVNYVPSWEEIQNGEQILLQVDELGDPEYVNFADIDLNECLVYRLVLSNP